MSIHAGGLKCEDCGADLPVKVCKSSAGYYVGQWCDLDGPYSRISQEYYPTREEAVIVLAAGDYTVRHHP